MDFAGCRFMPIKENLLNKFNTESIKQFKINTLSSVEIELYYDELQEFSKLQYAFSSNFRKIYPFKESCEISVLPDDFPEDEEKFDIKTISGISYWDDSENPNYKVMLTPIYLSFKCLEPKKVYETFDLFYNDFEAIFLFLEKTIKSNSTLDNILIDKISFRQINKINTEHRQFLNSDFWVEAKLFEGDPEVTYKEFRSQEKDCNIVLRIGLIEQIDPDEIIYDFEIYNDNPRDLMDMSSETLKSTLNNFRVKIYNLYRYFVGDRFIENVLQKAKGEENND